MAFGYSNLCSTFREREREELDKRTNLKDYNPKARALVSTVWDRVRNYTEAKDYQGGLGVVNQALERDVSKLPRDQQGAARRKLLYKKGYLHEFRGTYEMADLPLSDLRRKEQFLQAIEAYIDADMVIGYGSDYLLRVSEAAGGAELPDLQVAALQKAFGGDNFVLADRSDMGLQAIMGDLERRAEDVVRFPSVPGGGEAKLLKDIHLPSAEDN